MEQQATFHCQACRARLDLRSDADAPSERRVLGPALMSALDGGSIEESFIVLDSARRGGGPAGAAVGGVCMVALRPVCWGAPPRLIAQSVR